LILSRPDLLDYIGRGALDIRPPVAEESVAQVSVDLRLGRKFIVFKEPPQYLPAIYVDPSLWESADLWQHYERDVFRLIGVTIHVTAPKIDPGFDAQITLEMANFGRVPVDLRAGVDQPAQLILFRVSTPLGESELYGTRKEDRFQGQTEPIPRRKRSSRRKAKARRRLGGRARARSIKRTER
jgi:deoxycytidine triphosphate deaminase